MRTFGALMMLIGLIGLFGGMQMDTTVTSDFGATRTHNIGLLSDKQNTLLVFAVVSVVGVILFALGGRRGPPPAADSRPRVACPHCAEQILPDAIVCRFCGRDVARTPTPPAPESDQELMARYGIRQDGRWYRLGEHKYALLRDAVAQAKLIAAKPGLGARKV